MELFAGVGGFRLGLERLNSGWETVWFNQWEPGRKKQWAHECYLSHFGNLPDLGGNFHTNTDITQVDKNLIPDHSLLVGGFPCQDYSVARPAHSKDGNVGIQGKKGVLWWEIYRTIVAKKPNYCLFENVDRLLKSPTSQRGRDFGVMLTCLNDLGYAVEWQVVNSAIHGSPQRRKRVYLFVSEKSTPHTIKLLADTPERVMCETGFFGQTFPTKLKQAPNKVKKTPHNHTLHVREGVEGDIGHNIHTTRVGDDVFTATESFTFSFGTAGYMVNGNVWTANIDENVINISVNPTNGSAHTSSSASSLVFSTLGEVLEKNVDEKYYIPPADVADWKYLKSTKKLRRVSSSGHEYFYSEGQMAFPDDLNKPSRTILTSEGLKNRTSHIIEDPETKRLRTLTPLETERLQGFNDNWTNVGMSNRMRYFMMGNALVVPMITRMGVTLNKIIPF